MKNYQKLYFKHYRIMLPDGETIECTRKECFASPAEPTTGNLFIQRWYYSPDHEMVIRLPRNAMGDEIHKANAADLKMQEREQVRANLCIGQTSTAVCTMTCKKCSNNEYCESLHRTTNGIKCKQKCDYCSNYMHRTLEIDKAVSRTNEGDESGFDIADDVPDALEILIKKETVTSIRVAVDTLNPEERHLWDELLSEKTKAKIAEEYGISEGAIRKRVKKLALKLSENPALKNYFE